jgi:small subunit ribosomal protein S3
MGQKIHPLGLRLGITQKHRSKWFAKKTDYPRLILEDRFFRNYLLKTYPKARIVDINIVREPALENYKTGEKIELAQILIYTPSPRQIVGIRQPKQELEDLREKLSKICAKERAKLQAPTLRLNINVNPVKDPFSEASVIADDLIEQLEKRTAFRAALKRTLNRVEEKTQRLQGTRIQIAGRLNGAEIARIEWTRKGRVPLQTLRADVGYVAKTAKTIHGILGIKVWTFTKEKI